LGVVSLLLVKGANKQLPDSYQKTALQLANENEHFPVVSFLSEDAVTELPKSFQTSSDNIRSFGRHSSNLNLRSQQSLFLSKLNWRNIPEKPMCKVSVGGNHVWGVDFNQDIFKWNGKSWDAKPGKAICISCSSDGSVWCVSSTDEVFAWDESTWVKQPGSLVHVAVGSKHNIWGLTRAQEIMHWNFTSSNWDTVDGAATNLDVGEDGWVWCVNSMQQVFCRFGKFGYWERKPGALTCVSVHDANTVIGNNAAGEILLWRDNTWIQLNGTTTDISTGTPGHTKVWGVDVNQQVWCHGK